MPGRLHPTEMLNTHLPRPQGRCLASPARHTWGRWKVLDAEACGHEVALERVPKAQPRPP